MCCIHGICIHGTRCECVGKCDFSSCDKPCGVANAEISFARSLKGICQNPFNKSNFETYFALPTLSTQSSICGMGNVSVFVRLLTFR